MDNQKINGKSALTTDGTGSSTAESKSKKFDKKEKKFGKHKIKSKLTHGNSNEKFEPGNDFSWWNKYPELIRDSSNFKSNYIPGRPISSMVQFLVPGAIQVRLSTAYGLSNSPTDPLNVWARDLYLRMFQKYRPASGYTAADLGITILAALEAVKVIAHYERIYGIVNRYSVMNVNMPLVEARAVGLTSSQVDYLQSHMSDFRYDLNFLIRKAQRLCIPKDISLIADAISLFGYEYCDHDDPKAQAILIKLSSYGVYSDTALTSGGCINFFETFDADLFDFNADNMCKALSNVLNALLGSDSVQRIFADLVVWFGAENMLEFLPLPEDYIVVPLYSESILHKVHNFEMVQNANVVTCGVDNALASADQVTISNFGNYFVYQVDDRIVSVPTVHYNTAVTYANTLVNGRSTNIAVTPTIVYGLDEAHIIDGYRTDVDPEFVVEASLFKCCARYFKDPNGANYARIIDSCTAYIGRGIYMLYNSAVTPITAVPTLLVADATSTYTNAGILSTIDWAPLAYNVTNSSGNDVDTIGGDVDVLVPVNKTELTRIQSAALLSGLHTDVMPKV